MNTSNSILLIEKENIDQHAVHDDLSSTIELLPCLARLGRIDELLQETAYSGQKNEKKVKEEAKVKKEVFLRVRGLMISIRNYIVMMIYCQLCKQARENC